MHFGNRTTVFVSLALFLLQLDAVQPAAVNEKSLDNQAGVDNQARQLIQYLTRGPMMGKGYEWLANLTDTFGHRHIGSAALDNAIAFLVDSLTADGFSNVHTEEVPNLPNWVRGVEEATLLSPRRQKMALTTLGRSPPGEVTADAVVVRSFAELQSLGAQGSVRGKIVVYNQPWVSYGVSVAYRHGAKEAVKYGAVAALTRSVAAFSVYSPHTGHGGNYGIPAACITVEDAEMLWRMQQRGQPIRIHFKSTSGDQGTISSRNTVFEIVGSEKPNEIVLLSGHMDSWDIGQGAMDDGGGCAVMWAALTAIMHLGYRPKRTIRVVFWTAEEEGLLGSQYYHQQHKAWNNETFFFVSESDEGAFRPTSTRSKIYFSGNASVHHVMERVVGLLAQSSIPLGMESAAGGGLGDVLWWGREGVPGLQYRNNDKMDYYFTFHHSDGDTMTVFKQDDLDYVAAIYAVVAHVIANLEQWDR